MAVVIGSQTIVSMTIPFGSGNYSDFCFVSINWGYNPNIQRYYCLGQTTPTYSISKPTESLSIAVYSPYDASAPYYDVSPSDDCDDQTNKISASVSPGICDSQAGDYIGPISTLWYLNNYGFSKDDANLPGQETWALTAYPTEDLEGNPTSAVIPDAVIRGISEGQATVSFTAPYNDADPGVVFAAEGQIKASTGSVQGGGQGRIDYLTYGTANTVGGSGNLPSQAAQFGRTGQGSVSVQQQAIWY